jgi:ribosome-binding ATPase
VQKQHKGNPKEAAEILHHLDELAGTLKAGNPLNALSALPRSAAELARELCLLTLKPVLVVANVDDDLAAREAAGLGGAAAPAPSGVQLERLRRSCGAEVIPLAVRMEEELSRLAPDEKAELARELGFPEESMHTLVERSRRLLGLITFYTIANNKLRAWLIPEGMPAPQAAGKIHTDMEKGFIRMEVFSHDDVLQHGSRSELHRHGLVRVEGKEYVVRDGDVVQVLFHAP